MPASTGVESAVSGRFQVVGMGTMSAVVTALQAAGIRSVYPATEVFEPYHLGFPSARAVAMATGAAGSNRDMEPPSGFASIPMHAPMPWGQPHPAAPNGARPVASPPYGRPCAHRHPSALSAPYFSIAAPAPYHPTTAPTPPPLGFWVRPPGQHAGAGARPPPLMGPLALRSIVSTLSLTHVLMSM
jgi:hypothetical protein